jgi:hypothetical protein
VVTADQLRDFDRFRGTVPPFHTVECAHWRALPHEDYIRPDSPAYRRLRKPRLVHPAAYFDRASVAGRAGPGRPAPGRPPR